MSSGPSGSSGLTVWKGPYGFSSPSRSSDPSRLLGPSESSGSLCHRTRPGGQAHSGRRAHLDRRARSGCWTRLDYRVRQIIGLV